MTASLDYPIYPIADPAHFAAQRRYNERYNNRVFTVATEGISTEDANVLIDTALALCGSPYYAAAPGPWSAAAFAFLRLFA